MTDTKKDGAKRPCIYMLRAKTALSTPAGPMILKKGWQHTKTEKVRNIRGAICRWSPVYLEYLPDKIAATRREAEIKKLTAEKKRKLVESESNELCRRSGRLMNNSKPSTNEEQK